MTSEAAKIATIKKLHDAIHGDLPGYDFETRDGAAAEWHNEEFVLGAHTFSFLLDGEVLVTVRRRVLGQPQLFSVEGRVDYVAFMVNKFLDSSEEGVWHD